MHLRSSDSFGIHRPCLFLVGSFCCLRNHISSYFVAFLLEYRDTDNSLSSVLYHYFEYHRLISRLFFTIESRENLLIDVPYWTHQMSHSPRIGNGFTWRPRNRPFDLPSLVLPSRLHRRHSMRGRQNSSASETALRGEIGRMPCG